MQQLRRASVLLLALGLLSRFSAAQAAPVGISVEFTQLNWLGAGDGEVLVPASRVGQAEFRFTPEGAALLVAEGAYLNLVTSTASAPQWAVRNLYLKYPSISRAQGSSPSVMFNLGNQPGEPVNTLYYALSVTRQPLADSGGLQPTELALVAAKDYHTGGYDGGGSSLSALPDLISTPWPPVRLPLVHSQRVGESDPDASGSNPDSIPPKPSPPPPSSSSLIGGDEISAVDEDKNGCAPASIARSIAYLADNAGAERPPVQDIYDDLYDNMSTTVRDGTWDWNIIPGKQDYVDDNGLPIDTYAGGWPEFGEWVNGYMMDLMNALENGADIEIMIKWFPSGGHAAMVTDIRFVDGYWQITYVDDPHQGDGWEENQEHTIWVDADGFFGHGWIAGFIAEFDTSEAPE